MLKIGKDMVTILRIFVSISMMGKNVHMVINVLIHIQEFNNYINIRRIKKNFVHTIRIILKNVNMGIIALLLIVRIKFVRNSYIIINLMKISTCFIIKLNFVHLTSPNMTKLYVYMHIISKTTVEIHPSTTTNP
jgi:hypothetical protein